MSLTLQLLRMDAEDVWTRHRQRRQRNAASAASAEAKPEAAVNCAKVVAEAPHSYYDCCINVHVSSLLEHWLDWDSKKGTSSSSHSAHSACDCSRRCPHDDSDHASAAAATAADDSDSDDSGIGLGHFVGGGDQDEELQAEWIRQICANGCDYVNRADSDGKTILHYLLEGNDVKLYGNSLVSSARLLLDTGADPNAKDSVEGDTALLHVRHLLRRGLFSEAAQVAEAMLAVGGASLPNRVNAANRTLLSYAVACGDAAADLSRLLLNRGARVWPSPDAVAEAATGGSLGEDEIVRELATEREQSAFAAFMREVMRRQSLEGFEATLELLCHAMGENPARMRSHVPRTMLELGKGAGVNGPLFVRLKERLAPFWSRPQPLRYQCLKRIRRAMGPKRLNNRGSVARLRLPPKLQRAVLLEDATLI